MWMIVVMDFKGQTPVQTFGPFAAEQAAKDYRALYLPSAHVVPHNKVGS